MKWKQVTAEVAFHEAQEAEEKGKPSHFMIGEGAQAWTLAIWSPDEKLWITAKGSWLDKEKLVSEIRNPQETDKVDISELDRHYFKEADEIWYGDPELEPENEALDKDWQLPLWWWGSPKPETKTSSEPLLWWWGRHQEHERKETAEHERQEHKSGGEEDGCTED